jgi:HSP20 family protein
MNELLSKAPNVTQEQPKQRTYTPLVDILEHSDELILTLDLPGVKAEDVDLHFERGELTVEAVRQPRANAGRVLADEFQPGNYHRAFLISQDVAADKITADLSNGVLTVRLPKAEAAQPRRIGVRG